MSSPNTVERQRRRAPLDDGVAPPDHQPMGRRANTEAILDRLLELAAEAGALDQHEVAYHALMAALHAAEETGDVGNVARVESVADAENRRVEACVPPHNLSSVMAAARGTQSLYSSFHTHAEALRARMAAADVVHRAQARRTGRA
jgi:hypothetical protein